MIVFFWFIGESANLLNVSHLCQFSYCIKKIDNVSFKKFKTKESINHSFHIKVKTLKYISQCHVRKYKYMKNKKSIHTLSKASLKKMFPIITKCLVQLSFKMFNQIKTRPI